MDFKKNLFNKNLLWCQFKKPIQSVEVGTPQGQILVELALVTVLLFAIAFWFGDFAYDVSKILMGSQMTEDQK